MRPAASIPTNKVEEPPSKSNKSATTRESSIIMTTIIDSPEASTTRTVSIIERVDGGGTPLPLEGETNEEQPGPLVGMTGLARGSSTPGRYSDLDALNLFQLATDEVSGALSDVSFGTSVSSASSRECYSLPLESSGDANQRSPASGEGRQQNRRDRDDMTTSSSRIVATGTRDQYGDSTGASRASSSKHQHHNGRLKSARKRPSRLLLAKNLVVDAARFLETGEDEKSLQAYQQAIQIAGSEIARINAKIRITSTSHNDAVQRSIKDRLGQDLRKVGISIGKVRTKMAIVYERLGDYDNAILCCREAAALYKNLPNNSSEGSSSKAKSKTGVSSDLVQAIQLMIQQLQSTKEALKGRDEILKEVNECRADADRACSVEQRAKCYIRMEKLASAAMAVEVKILGACHPQVADSLQLLSTISLELSNAARAIHFLDQALAISRECLGDKHPRIGQYCLRLARICQSSGAEAKAVENFERAAQVLSHSKKYSRILGSTMNDLAVLYMRRGETSVALEKLHVALKYYTVKSERFKSSSLTETVMDDLIQVHQNMATCYMAEGSFGRACETYAEVLVLQRRSREVYDDVGGDESLRRQSVDEASIAQTLVNMGRASAADGAHDKAIKCLKKALGMLNTLAAEEGAKGEADAGIFVDYKRRITKLMYCIAEECVATKNLDEAMAFYTDSIGIFNLLGPRHQGKNSGHIAHCHIGISKVLALRNDAIGAHALLKKTLRNCVSGTIDASYGTVQAVKARLAEIDAELMKPTEECLQVVEENARDQINEGAFHAAMMNLRVALSIRKRKMRQLKAIKADVSAEVKGVANLMDMFGLVYENQGDTESSSRAYAEAYRLRSKRNK